MRLTRREALLATGALALSRPAHAAADDAGVGSVADIVNYAWSTVAPEPREEIEFEDAVFMNELIETDDESAVVVHFADGSKLTVGENARVVVDEGLDGARKRWRVRKERKRRSQRRRRRRNND